MAEDGVDDAIIGEARYEFVQPDAGQQIVFRHQPVIGRVVEIEDFPKVRVVVGDPPAPHETIVVGHDWADPDVARTAVTASLTELGLTADEAGAFLAAWDEAFFGAGEIAIEETPEIERIPAEESPPPEDSTSGRQEDDSAKAAAAARVPSRRVLVVDDHEDAADSLATLLLLGGHQVRVAEDGHRGLQAILQNPPDIALVDVGLPGLTGYEIATIVRKNPALAKVKLVALTGYGRAEDRKMVLEAGFDEHLVKPVTPTELMQVLLNERRDETLEAHSPDAS